MKDRFEDLDVEKKIKEIRSQIRGNTPRAGEVIATSYKVDILPGEKRGPFKADGHTIRVTPLYEGAVLKSPFTDVLEEVSGDWLSTLELVEDGDPLSLAYLDLAWDVFYGQYTELRIKLSPEQIEEIKQKYPGQKFDTEIKGYIKE